jgi:hypothetical protein
VHDLTPTRPSSQRSSDIEFDENVVQTFCHFDRFSASLVLARLVEDQRAAQNVLICTPLPMNATGLTTAHSGGSRMAFGSRPVMTARPGDAGRGES